MKTELNLFETVMVMFHNRHQMTFREIHSELEKTNITLSEDQLNVIVRRLTNKDYYLSWSAHSEDSWLSTFTLEKKGEDKIYDIFKKKILLQQIDYNIWDSKWLKAGIIGIYLGVAISVIQLFCPTTKYIETIQYQQVDILRDDISKLRIELRSYFFVNTDTTSHPPPP